MYLCCYVIIDIYYVFEVLDDIGNLSIPTLVRNIVHESDDLQNTICFDAL